MDKEKDYVYSEPEKTCEEKTLDIIINEFKDILKEVDADYEEKIFFNVSYNLSGEYFKVNIFPVTDGFNSRKYFIKNFETKAEKKLSKFADENGIGLITY